MGAGGARFRRETELSYRMARIAVVLFGPEGRGGFNQAGLAGAGRARAAASELEVVWCEPPAPEARAEHLRKLCRQGFDLIVAHGGQGDAPVALVAADYPSVRFAITQGGYTAANVACYEALQEQSAFLAGVLAATETRTGVVAHMSGERVRPGLKGRAAFADGVARAAPDVRLLTCFCGDQHDPELAYRIVTAQAAQGADILFAMIDGGRAGAIRACREHGMRQIGNVIDWTVREPDVFIASAIADSGACVERAVRDFLSGQLRLGERCHIGIEAPAVVRLEISPSVGAAARAVVTRFEAMLRSGEIEPAADFYGKEMA